MDAVAGLKRLAEDQIPGVSDAKKTKVSDNSQPSRVLHVRSLPASTTEFEVAALAAPFGRVTNIMLLRQRNQALMELEDEAVAATCCNYYNYTPAMIRGQTVQLQHSRHTELVLSPSTSIGPASGAAGVDGPNVLHVMVDNMIYPVTLDVLHTIFSKYGTVLRIITFTKNGQFQALVELADSTAASTAKLALDGQNIYDRCCTMRIDSSKLATLTVSANTDRQRDYTKPDVADNVTTVRPMMLGGGTAAASIAGLPGLPAGMSALQNLMAGSRGIGGISAANMSALGGVSGGTPVLLVSNLNEEVVTPNDLFILFGVYGDVQRVKVLFNKKDTALIQFATGQQAQTAQRFLHRVTFQNKVMHVTSSKHTTVAMPKEDQDASLTKDFTDSALHRYKQPGSHNLQNIYPPSASLHLSNVPASVTQETLERLFLMIAPSVVTFKWIASTRPEDVAKSDRKMALIQLPSTELAIQALVMLHNHKFEEKRYLRVSFAKNATVQ